MGGWIQLKYKPKANFELNFALGQDNPFAGEPVNFSSRDRVLLWAAHVAQPDSVREFHIYITPVRMSYSQRNTGACRRMILDGNLETANQIGLSVGYIF